MRCTIRGGVPEAVATAPSTFATGKPSRTAIQSSSSRSPGETRSRPASGWSRGTATSSGSRSSGTTRSPVAGHCAPSGRWATTTSTRSVSAGKSSSATSSSEHSTVMPPSMATRVSSGGSSSRAPLWNAETRTVPSGRSRNAAQAARARSTATATSTAASASASPAAVSRRPRPTRSVSGTPASRDSAASCWDTAEGVRCRTAAAAPTPPWLRTVRRVSRARTSMQRRYIVSADPFAGADASAWGGSTSCRPVTACSPCSWPSSGD